MPSFIYKTPSLLKASMLMVNFLKKRRTIPVRGENMTFFKLQIYHFPKHKHTPRQRIQRIYKIFSLSFSSKK